jgi:hypothetical protein
MQGWECGEMNTHALPGESTPAVEGAWVAP